MGLQNIIKCSALLFGLASSIKVLELPAGAWSIEESSDGSLISRSVDDPALSTIKTQDPLKLNYDLEATSTAVDEPYSFSDGLLWANGDCWSTWPYNINTAGIDRAVT
ncbi:hypothetical protein IFR04_007672 [Cadophora malorum]|uniref:Uncharacterized protein n=1 Tax=Cadophora malorum TaxID=108018 RepID=A0A8H7W6A2_9HELO|nr:hypothetical protein IFR04_007672 [Cadophora malorum]